MSGRYYGRPARRSPSAADRAAARRELEGMRSSAAFAFGRGRLTDEQYAAELARIEGLAESARKRGLL